MIDRFEKKIIKALELGLKLNPMSTMRRYTGDKPTVFLNFYGHIAAFHVDICLEGWDEKPPYLTAKKQWEIYFDRDSEQQIDSQLDDIITTLDELLKRWCEDE